MALKITLVRSLNSCKKNQIATAHSLGLRKIRSETTQPDNEATRGLITQRKLKKLTTYRGCKAI